MAVAKSYQGLKQLGQPYAVNGKIHAGVTPGVLREELYRIQQKNIVKDESSKFKLLKGIVKNEGKNDE